jgi:hypothetical protein
MTETIANSMGQEFNLQAEIEVARRELEHDQIMLERVKNQEGSVAVTGLFELSNLMARVDQSQRRLDFLQGDTDTYSY